MVVETFKKQNIPNISPEITNNLVYNYKLKILKYLWLLELSIKLLWNNRKLNGKTIILNDFGALLSYSLVRKITQFEKQNHKVAYIHHGLMSEANTRFRRQKQMLLDKILDKMSVTEIAVSNFVRNRLTKKRNITTLHIPAFLMEYPSVDQLVPKSDDDDRIILFCACRINEKKVSENSIRFLNQIGQKICRNITLKLAGTGDSNVVNRLERLCADLPYVELNIMGQIDRGEVQKSILNADIVFNMSTLYEGAPTLGYEAALLDRPYMFLDRGGHIETAQYNRRGYISIGEFNEENVSQTADEILNILSKNYTNNNYKLPSLDETIGELIARIQENDNEIKR